MKQIKNSFCLLLFLCAHSVSGIVLFNAQEQSVVCAFLYTKNNMTEFDITTDKATYGLTVYSKKDENQRSIAIKRCCGFVLKPYYKMKVDLLTNRPGWNRVLVYADNEYDLQQFVRAGKHKKQGKVKIKQLDCVTRAYYTFRCSKNGRRILTTSLQPPEGGFDLFDFSMIFFPKK